MRIDSHPYMRRIREEFEERRKWTEENPLLAQEWEEAVREDERRREHDSLQREIAAQEEAIPSRLVAMGCPRRAAEACRKLRRTTAIEAVDAFAPDPDQTFLLLVGFPGTGKTVAACSALRYRDVAHGRFIRAADAAVMQGFGGDADREWRRLCVVPWLILDDLGVEAMNDWWRGRIEGLIDTRYGDMLKTVITTNLGAEQFKKTYGERIARRVRESGAVRAVGTKPLEAP